MKMSKYSDDFFSEYEEIYSDSNKKNVRFSAANDSDEYDLNDFSSGRSQRNREYYDYDREDFDRNRRALNEINRRAVRSKNVYGGSARTQNRRNPSGQRPYKLRRKTRRTLILTVGIIFLLAILTGIVAIAVSAGGVGKVESLQVSELTANQAVLSWEKVNHADGYRVLMAQGDSQDYQEYLRIDDPDTCTATVSGLDQAVSYSFCVTAFRGEKEGEQTTLNSVWTLPEAPEITNIYSAKKGEIHLDWSANDKANGYVVEYKKDGGEYGSDTTLTVSDPTECRADITDLETGATYYVRVAAYLSGEEQLTGERSAEQSVQVVAEDTPVTPKAPKQTVDSAIDPDKPMIALTFDDGPLDGGSGEKILDVLEQYNARATFFMVGCNVTDHADNLKRKVRLKMELGNHTWNHAHYGNEVTPDDISMASNTIYDVCGQYPTCFRSPGGMTTDAILNECAAEGMSAYYWSIDTEDWNSKDSDAVYHAVVDYVQDGDIVLMHEIYDSTADAVEKMVPELIDRGFQLVTCHDLMTIKGGSEPVPGKQYRNAFEELAP